MKKYAIALLLSVSALSAHADGTCTDPNYPKYNATNGLCYPANECPDPNYSLYNSSTGLCYRTPTTTVTPLPVVVTPPPPPTTPVVGTAITHILPPVLISLVPPSVSAGVDSSVAVRSDGTVVAWGANLGDGTSAISTSPKLIPGLNNVVAVSIGSDKHTVALKSDGTMMAWGTNSNGQLGDGTQTAESLSPIFVSDFFSSNVTAVSAGIGRTVAVNFGGTVAVWGNDSTDLSGLTGIVAVSSGGGYKLLEGAVSVILDIDVPSSVSDKSTFIGIHSLALKSDGTVMEWGYSCNSLSCPPTYSTDPVLVPNLSAVKAVAVGVKQSVALKSDGTVMVWESNLGDGTNNISRTPVLVPGLTGVVGVSAGTYLYTPNKIPGFVEEANPISHTVVVKSNGTVVAWGNNSSGQLGDGTTSSRLWPRVVPGLSGVVAVSAGRSHTVALKSDGTVVAWGDNSLGQLGDGTKINRLRPVTVCGLNLGTGPASVSQICNDLVFDFAQENYTEIFNGEGTDGVFNGAWTAGNYQQYSYRYYPATGNYLAIDATGTIFVLGPYTNNVLTAAGKIIDYMSAIIDWNNTRK